MPAITFKGDVREAAGASVILIVNAVGYDYSEIFDGTFTRTKNLPSGNYEITVVCLTEGEMDFNISGNLISVNPVVPETFDSDKIGNSYKLKV